MRTSLKWAILYSKKALPDVAQDESVEPIEGSEDFDDDSEDQTESFNTLDN